MLGRIVMGRVSGALSRIAVIILSFCPVPTRAEPEESGSSGGSDADKSIRAALIWLARHQAEDGSWSAEGLSKRCDPGTACIEPSNEMPKFFGDGVTGLALLAFLRAGRLPASTEELADPVGQTRHVAGQVVTRGLDWLTAQQTERGSFGKDKAFVYAEAAAALALVEAYSATQDERWKEPAQRAVDFLQGAQLQHPSGEGRWGWRYAPLQDLEAGVTGVTGVNRTALSESDTSATGWVVEVLMAARAAGLEVFEGSFAGALDYLDSVSGAEGLVGYLTKEQGGMKVLGPHDEFDYHVGTLSALGIVIHLGAGTESAHEFYAAAALQVTKDLPRVSSDKLSVDYYYWYQGSLALNSLQERQAPKKGKKKLAEAWNRALVESVCSTQDRSKQGCRAGGWVLPDRWSHSAGPVYSTAMCVLALETCAKR